jgi:hypothetical protein
MQTSGGRLLSLIWIALSLEAGACVVDDLDDAAGSAARLTGESSDALAGTEAMAVAATTGITVVALTNDQAIQVSAAAGVTRYYKLDVPAGHDGLLVLRSGSYHAGVDIYVRRGALPSPTSFDCRQLDGYLQSCELDQPAAGTYYVMLRATTGYQDLSFLADYYDFATALGNDALVHLAYGAGVNVDYKLDVPAGTSALTFRLGFDPADVDGKADLLVKRGSAPTATSYDCARTIDHANFGTDPVTCSFGSAPQAGRYYVQIVARRRYAAWLTGRYDYPLTVSSPTTTAN